MSNNQITLERLKELISYDEKNGEFKWLVYRNIKSAAGSIAGSIHPTTGYRLIGIDGRKHRGHRLAWFYTFGRWPVGEIDHIDGNPSNNRISNLREATRSENCANRKTPKSNQVGLKGASWVASSGRWKSQIKMNGRHYYLGHFATPEEAHLAYCQKSKILHGKFARTK